MPAVSKVRSVGLLAAVVLATSVTAVEGRPPRLVVVLIVDQMRDDYIEQYGERWTGGLRRLVTQGARFRAAAYPYLNTVTCPGHATISTGTFPATHGVVLNSWWDRAGGADVACMADASVASVAFNSPDVRTSGYSPRHLRASTFADELRGQAGRAPRVVSLAVKPRSAVALAGQGGDLVVWIDRGGLTTSTAYSLGEAEVVKAFARTSPLEPELTRDWVRLLPEGQYSHADDAEGELPPAGWTRAFPHAISSQTESSARAALWAASPLVDEYLGRLAENAVDKLALGQRPGTDYLAISFSTLDSAGHSFGPRSHEVQDVLYRIDRILGRLLDRLDRTVGRDHYVVALSSDHGVSPIPEQAARLGLDAGRVDLGAVAREIESRLAARFGSGTYVSRIAYTDVYLAPGVYEKLKSDAAWPELRAALEGMPGIARAFGRDEIAQAAADGDPAARAVRLSYFAERSGDLILVPRPYWITSSAAATHGTLYSYDQRVPVVFHGSGIRPGVYWDAATPADIAPTLAALCGITMARTDGRVLGAALAPATPGWPARPEPSGTR